MNHGEVPITFTGGTDSLWTSDREESALLRQGQTSLGRDIVREDRPTETIHGASVTGTMTNGGRKAARIAADLAPHFCAAPSPIMPLAVAQSDIEAQLDLESASSVLVGGGATPSGRSSPENVLPSTPTPVLQPPPWRRYACGPFKASDIEGR